MSKVGFVLASVAAFVVLSCCRAEAAFSVVTYVSGKGTDSGRRPRVERSNMRLFHSVATENEIGVGNGGGAASAGNNHIYGNFTTDIEFSLANIGQQ